MGFSAPKFFSRTIVLLLSLSLLCIYYYSQPISKHLTITAQVSKRFISPILNLTQALNIVDLRIETRENYTCIKTKRLVNTTATTICVHDSRDAVSNEIVKKKVWEEELLTRILQFLQRYPQMSFLDVGANVGTYTMFVASSGRDVISIECFKPNLERIRRAIQMEHLEDRVTLVGNAIHAQTGRYFKMRSDPFNVGSQAVIVDNQVNLSDSNDTYVVKTIQFDDILPLLKAKNIEHAVMKVDIQWAEMYLCQTGNKVFDSINIPVVLMEWDIGARLDDRLLFLLKYFTGRGYVPTADMCQVLPPAQALQSWPSHFFWMKSNRSLICQ